MDGTAHWVVYDTTTYTHDEHDDAWQCAKCDAYWTFIDGGPVENKMHYCPECGRYITDVVRMEDDDDDDSDDT